MSYGIAAFNNDGKLTFHSDYASTVFLEKITTPTETIRAFTKEEEGNNATKGYTSEEFLVGFVSVYVFTPSNYEGGFMPFFKPLVGSGYHAPLSFYFDSSKSKWVAVVLHEVETLPPEIYLFGPLSGITNVTDDLEAGIQVFDANGGIVLHPDYTPLQVDGIRRTYFPQGSVTSFDPLNPSTDDVATLNALKTDLRPTLRATAETPCIIADGDSMYSWTSNAYAFVRTEVVDNRKRCCKKFIGACVKKRATQTVTLRWTGYRGVIKYHDPNRLMLSYLGDQGGKYLAYGQGSCGWDIGIGLVDAILDTLESLASAILDIITLDLGSAWDNLTGIFDSGSFDVTIMDVPIHPSTNYLSSIIITKGSYYD